jgi:hypothetical protein
MHDMERAGIEIVNLICDNRQEPEIIGFPPSSSTTTIVRHRRE